MKYDFTTVTDRMGKDATCVDALGRPGVPGLPKEGFSAIPMWVADMNFPCAPCIVESMERRLSHPLFGYFAPSDEFYHAIIDWLNVRHGVKGLSKECIGYENGVLGGLVTAAGILCSKGDKILVHSPTYIGFTKSLQNNGYQLIHSPLYQDDQMIWRMDYEDMEQKIVNENIHCAVFCSPHNPTGRVWERGELERAMALFQKHDVYVIADEIWADIVTTGYTHITTQSVSTDARQRTIALYAPSKTFSLAGLVGSYHIIFNKRLRDRAEKEASLSHYNSMNVLSMHALIGAYSGKGQEWASQLCEVLTENIRVACDYFEKIDGITFSKPQGTYMLFIDCTKWCKNHQKTLDDLLKSGWDVGVAWQDGRPFHGSCHIRINLALPKQLLEEALSRLDQYVFE